MCQDKNKIDDYPEQLRVYAPHELEFGGFG